MVLWPGNAKNQATSFGGLNRAELMARVRSRENKTTEQRLVGILRRAKLSGWRRNSNLLGHPDFVFRASRLAIFVDGCFWHGHNCKRNLTPKKNASLWREKISRNQNRDKRVNRVLRADGWEVLRFWECELKQNPERCLTKIKCVDLAR